MLEMTFVAKGGLSLAWDGRISMVTLHFCMVRDESLADSQKWMNVFFEIAIFANRCIKIPTLHFKVLHFGFHCFILFLFFLILSKILRFFFVFDPYWMNS